MKVFVTGATGYIGSAICDALRAAGHEALGLARSEEKAAVLSGRGDAALRGSLEDHEALRRGCREAGAVIHTALSFVPEAGAIDRAAVEVMLAALEGSNKPFIYTSGVWVYGDTGDRMLGEVAPLNPPALVAWRPAVEELVLEAKERGIRTMVFRPGMVFGRKGGFLAGFFHDARTHGAVRVIGDGKNYWSCVHADDLADLYVRAVLRPAAGELFVTCGGMPQQVNRIAEAVAEVCGVPGKVEHIPLEEARRQMGPIADCLAMTCKAGSTKPARFFGWIVRRPSVFDEIASGSYVG
ncbi:MAG: NAD-dependent epimerase/dehydratase family protein [Bryobacteraceae bacterium]|jgi:nucleoside-diphosphate-sugar epimerase